METGNWVIPVMDLDQNELACARVLRRAFSCEGVAFVRNHGIAESTRIAYFAAQHAFFALPTSEKMSIRSDLNNRGYTPMRDSTLDPGNSDAPDSHEGLYFGRHIDYSEPEAKLPLHGPNQWPREGVVPRYREATEAYYAAMMALVRQTIRILAISLDLPPDHFSGCFARPIASLRPLRFRSVAEETVVEATTAAPDAGMAEASSHGSPGGDISGGPGSSPGVRWPRQHGIGAHADYGCFSFLDLEPQQQQHQQQQREQQQHRQQLWREQSTHPVATWLDGAPDPASSPGDDPRPASPIAPGGFEALVEGEWMLVDPPADHLLISCGELLQRWTNDKYVASVHRLLGPLPTPRLSSTFYVEPNFLTSVEPLPSCCVDHPPKYEPVTAGRYILEKYRQTHEGYRRVERAVGEDLGASGFLAI